MTAPRTTTGTRRASRAAGHTTAVQHQEDNR